jgi:hypothetical protein
VLGFGAASLSPALADPRWDRDGHRHKHGHHYEHGPAPVVVVERPVYLAPRPRVVYAEPVYAWYPPPPRVAYYPPPGVSLTFNFD